MALHSHATNKFHKSIATQEVEEEENNQRVEKRVCGTELGKTNKRRKVKKKRVWEKMLKAKKEAR